MKNRLLEYDRKRQEEVRPRRPAQKESGGAPSGWMESVEAAIAKYPAVSLFAALTTGVMLGWLVKRK